MTTANEKQAKIDKEESSKTDTMRLWDLVSKTDVDHTKEVSFGRKFTAIDAHSQIMEATRLFGPVGEGWGYTNVYGETHLTDGRVIAHCDVTFWWQPKGEWEGIKTPGYRREFGPVRGAAMLTSFEKGKTTLKIPDTDAYKKASTDGLTKLISHLGFNADVFLGQFDDNKYVERLKKEKQAEQTAEQTAYAEDRAEFIKKIRSCTTSESIDLVLQNHTTWIAGLPAGTATELRAWVKKTQEELSRAEVKEKDLGSE